MRQFDPQQRGLHLVQPAVLSPLHGMIAIFLAIIPQTAQPRGETGIVGDHGSAVAEGPEVLGGIEAEGPQVADRAGDPAALPGAMALRTVLDEGEAMPL